LPLLGLPAGDFKDVAGKIDKIYHSGASVNFSYPYSILRATNVLGTQEILRLAAEGGSETEVHHISSLAVFGPDDGGNVQTEASIPARCSAIQIGYAQTKWVAEQFMVAARSRGFPVKIYRPGRISGHSETGMGPSSDFFWHLIRACIESACVPDVAGSVDLTPVDYVSAAIVRLASEPTPCQNFHLLSPNPVPLHCVFDALQISGYRMRQVSLDEWHYEVEKRALAATHERWATALFVALNFQEHLKSIAVDSSETRRALDRLGVGCPLIDSAALSRYIQCFRSNGMFGSDLS